MNSIKTILLAFAISVSLLFVSTSTSACEFKFKVANEKEQNYKVGDEIIVTVELTLTHRSCPEGLEKTKFDFVGLKALGATKWKDIGNEVYERKFKLLVTEEKKNRHVLSATRTCDKDGGAGSIKISVD